MRRRGDTAAASEEVGFAQEKRSRGGKVRGEIHSGGCVLLAAPRITCLGEKNQDERELFVLFII